jgi:hypothetical protein
VVHSNRGLLPNPQRLSSAFILLTEPRVFPLQLPCRIVPPLSRLRASGRRANAPTVADSPCHASPFGGKRVLLGSRCSVYRKSTRQRADGQQHVQQQQQQACKCSRCCFGVGRTIAVLPPPASATPRCSSHAEASFRGQADTPARQREDALTQQTSSAELLPSRTVDWRHADWRQADVRRPSPFCAPAVGAPAVDAPTVAVSGRVPATPPLVDKTALNES